MSLLKTTHASSQAAQSAKLRKLGATGSLKLARQAEHAPRKYASGGIVDSGSVEGAPSKPRLDRPGRKMGKDAKGKKGGTNVNVIIMPKGDAPAGGPKPMADGPPMPPPPGAGPGGPPPPPMPMRASGGGIANLGKFAWGGKVKKAEGKEDHKRGGKVCK